LEAFIDEHGDKGGDTKLDDEKQADTGTKLLGLTIQPSEGVDSCLPKRDNEGKGCEERRQLKMNRVMTCRQQHRRWVLTGHIAPQVVTARMREEREERTVYSRFWVPLNRARP